MLGTEYGWVIEEGTSNPSGPEYWAGVGRWSADNSEAIRFAREKDAYRVACGLRPQIVPHRVREHAWAVQG